MDHPEEPASAIVDALPRLHTEVLLMLVAGMTNMQIGSRLRIPVESVDALVDLARRKLKRAINDTSGTPSPVGEA